jgi:Ni,Fe-hydrogenase III small subunit
MINTLARMIRTGILTEDIPPVSSADVPIQAIQQHILKILGSALCIRHVDAGSCNGCELEIQALNNPYYNIEGIGIRFVASPRHADLLLVTGPVSVNMEEALKRTFEAVPDPKIVIAIGDCGACGGIFGKSYASRGAIADVIPVSHSVKGCPPSPLAILQAILQTIQSTTAETSRSL